MALNLLSKIKAGLVFLPRAIGASKQRQATKNDKENQRKKTLPLRELTQQNLTKP